jgi:hypothetical protein
MPFGMMILVVERFLKGKSRESPHQARVEIGSHMTTIRAHARAKLDSISFHDATISRSMHADKRQSWIRMSQ